MKSSARNLLVAISVLPASAAFANHADDVTELPEMVVTGDRGSLTSNSVAAQKKQLNQTAGSVGFVDSEDYQNRYASNLHDVLGSSPGVFVETRYGQELRLSIRGSGLARGYHTRGLLILQDGIPTNLADGSGDYYQIDPLALRYTEIYKGGNGLAYGASTLGGAINFVTPTARTALSPASIRVEAGGYGNERVSGQASGIFGNTDALANVTLSHSDGWRDHSRGDYGQFNGNVGYRINSNVETRFYGGVYIVNQLLPGSLTLSQVENDPTAATSASVSGDQARDSRTERIANRTSIKLDNGQIDFDSWYIHKALNHPIFQVLDEHGDTFGFAPRYSGAFNILGMRNELYSGLQFFGGRNHAQRFNNVGGNKGAQTLDSEQVSKNYEAYFENRLFLNETVALMAGAKLFRDQRKFENNSISKNDSKTYDGFNPKLGVLWLPKKDVQVFADIARSQDVPDFGDLNQNFGPASGFVALEAQKAWTLEIGTRGKRDRLSWDFTVYRAELRDEMLQYTKNVNAPANTFNADRTRHQGLEAGLSYDALRDNFVAGDRVTINQTWTLNDFAFVNDPTYGNNKIPGAPRNVLRTSIAYTQNSGFYFTPTLDWVPQGAWADDSNTVRVKGYALIGLQTGMEWHSGISIFVDARNLANRRYVSDISTVNTAVKDTSSTPGSSIYYPGDGRNVYAGVRYAF